MSNLEVFQNPLQLAEHFVKSGFFKDAKDIHQTVVKIVIGREMGIPATVAMTGVHIILGKPALGANILASKVKASGKYNYKIIKCDNSICTIEFFENGTSQGSASFSIEEAKGASLTGKDNWKSYASDMLFARAISRGVRRYCPDVLGGITAYTPDDLRGVEIIEKESSPCDEDCNKEEEIHNNISDKQIKRMYKLAYDMQWSNDQIKDYLVKVFNLTSSKDIQKGEMYDSICEYFSTHHGHFLDEEGQTKMLEIK